LFYANETEQLQVRHKVRLPLQGGCKGAPQEPVCSRFPRPPRPAVERVGGMRRPSESEQPRRPRTSAAAGQCASGACDLEAYGSLARHGQTLVRALAVPALEGLRRPPLATARRHCKESSSEQPPQALAPRSLPIIESKAQCLSTSISEAMNMSWLRGTSAERNLAPRYHR